MKKSELRDEIRAQWFLAEKGDYDDQIDDLIKIGAKVAHRHLKKQGKALDVIAEECATDDYGSWSDMSGKLESIGNLVESTGRKVDWE